MTTYQKLMKTPFSPNHLITSINFNYLSTSNKSIDFSIRRSHEPINSHKENIDINSNIYIQNKEKLEKLKLSLQKKPIKIKFLKHNFVTSQKKFNLQSYKQIPLKIFEPNSFNNTSIKYSKHVNTNTSFIKNHLTNNYQKKIEEKKIKNYGEKEKNNFIVNSPISITHIRNRNERRNQVNENLKHFNSIENESFSNQNKLKLSYNFSLLKYKTSSKNFQNLKKDKDNSMNKSTSRLTNYFSPPKFETSKLEESIDLQKSCRIYTNKRNNEFKFTIVNPDDFKIIKQIGFGSFGKIYKTLYIKNGNKYALKVMHSNKNNILYMQEKVKIIMNLEKSMKCDGLIKIYGDSLIKNGNQYYYYEVLELADKDWEKEIISRRRYHKYYSEDELINIMWQLVKTLSLLQKNHITHRDIKLQNILLLNNQYKICDFGEARKLMQKGIIVQPIRGSELYMSPIQFFGLERKFDYVQHNTYKSDVFSLGMCILFAANLNDDCLYDIRELKDMDKIKNIVMSYLSRRYSLKFIHCLLILLEIQEKNRPDFIALEDIILKTFHNNNKRMTNYK